MTIKDLLKKGFDLPGINLRRDTILEVYDKNL